MKEILLILTALLLFTGCNEGETEQQSDLITENATIYNYHDPIFGGSFCFFVIETENNEIFAIPRKESNLSEFNSSTQDATDIKITYRLTTDKVDRCLHKDGFLEPSPTVIEILAIEKI